MADVYGVNSTKVYNTKPAELLAGKHMGAVRRTCSDRYEAAAAAIGTKIFVGFIPHGARLLAETRVFFDALGASSTLKLIARKIADATETDLIAAASTAAAGSLAPGIDEVGAEINGDSYLMVVTAGAIVTGTIKSEVAYAAEGG